MKFNYYNLDDTSKLYKATAIYKIIDNGGEFLCNLTNLKEARQKAKQSQGKIYKILQDESMNEIYNELWEDYTNK